MNQAELKRLCPGVGRLAQSCGFEPDSAACALCRMNFRVNGEFNQNFACAFSADSVDCFRARRRFAGKRLLK